MARCLFLTVVSLAVSFALVSCSKQSPTNSGSGGMATGLGTGGSLASGGDLGTGGSRGTGGSLASGGDLGTGGSRGTGGTPSSGTTTSSGGNGGRRGSSSANGGTSGGRTSTGGSAAVGGTDPGSAGTRGSGGSFGGSTAGSGGSAGSSQGGSPSTGGTGGATATSTFTFFVTSDKSKTANLGGLKAADQRCQSLAAAVGQGQQTWHAYLSVDADPDAGNPVHARDRIGKGPFYNAKGVLLAQDVEALHLLKGDAELFLDENGNKVPGNWSGSPTPIEHDILTGSQADGTLAAGKTCDSWTSADSTKTAIVGHSDGLGPGGATTGTYTSWNASHDNGSCADTAPKGGAGRLYCFAVQ